jgi:hypothetical protein
MAKQPPSPIGRSKVRMFYVDADLASGEMEQLTEALRNAIRPTHMITSAPALSQITGNGRRKTEAEIEMAETAETVSEVDNDDEQPSRPPRQRKYRSPKILSDLDLTGGGKKTFSDFASEKGNPTEHTTRYLIAAYWCADLIGVDTITSDHVYTCYRSAGWTFDVQDPTRAFRKLKSQGYGDLDDGRFTINHIGRSRVEKIAGQARAEG